MKDTRIKKVARFQTTDFSLFETFLEALEYQKELDYKAELNKATLQYQINQLNKRNNNETNN